MLKQNINEALKETLWCEFLEFLQFFRYVSFRMEQKQKYLNTVTLVEYLDAWATANNCNDDP